MIDSKAVDDSDKSSDEDGANSQVDSKECSMMHLADTQKAVLMPRGMAVCIFLPRKGGMMLYP